ncbi:unnamed protein product [Linum tenue]|uniref:Uncharacterized protein n=1 Tax=Linum tenue TaxID=586396 RepID=A0AAV0RFE6_9ROSI|nr:unnamed protein product [Linum tenue]
MMELRPKEQISAQRRTERTITTLASNVLSVGVLLYGSAAAAAGGGEEWRSLLAMVNWRVEAMVG